MLHIGSNLLPHEPITISQMLIDEYPTASIEDFDLMLKRGVMGRYSEKTLGFDVSVIFGWMAKYMEEWAEEKERQLAKDKNKIIEETDPQPNGIERHDIDKLLNDFKETLRDSKIKSVPNLTKEEIKREGQSTPEHKAESMAKTDWAYREHLEQQHRLKVEYGKLFTETNYNGTWKLKEGSPTFEQWAKNQ